MNAALTILQEICDMQTRNYGDGIETHLALINLCDKARAILAAAELASALTTTQPVQQPDDARASLPTEISERLRERARGGYTAVSPDDGALMLKAADECERFYGGMMAWKKTAEAKDQALATTRPSAALTDEMPRSEAVLRRLLAYRCAGANLYADDGELQDNTARPFIDFKRDSVDAIECKLGERTKAILAASGGAHAVPEGLERDLNLARRLTGTIYADTTKDYYPACNRVFAFVESVIAVAPTTQDQGEGK